MAMRHHRDRILKPMIREKITDPWREVSWEEAIGSRRVRVQAHPGEIRPDSVGGITSSRCTNEETFLVQKLIRAGFGNNNVDTCARVCHSPPAMACIRPSALRPARRISIRSKRPT